MYSFSYLILGIMVSLQGMEIVQTMNSDPGLAVGRFHYVSCKTILYNSLLEVALVNIVC